MEFLRTVVQQDVVLTASAQTDLIDLPVNPLSHILLTLRGRNDSATLSNYSFLTDFTAFITNIEVLFKGQSIIEGSLQDLMVLNALLTGFVPGLTQELNTDNNERAATFMLSFSRVPYWAKEAFPATSRGEFQLRITAGANPTGMDAFRMQVETVELINATPERFCKYTTYVGTAGSTGENDRDLPRGNPILGTLLFGTTISQITSGVNTIETAKVLVDNREQYYPLANFETLHGEMMRRLPSQFGLQNHFHSVDVTAVNATLTTGVDTGDVEFTDELLSKYAFLDFDPLKDTEYALMTEGKGRVAVRFNYGDTAVMRFMPIELMSIAGARPA